MIQNQEISEVTEIIEDQQRKDNFDFIYFSAFNKKFSTFPKGLHKYFPDLRHFTMDNCALTSISSADLAPWPKLYYFSVARNNIKTLDGDLFQNSPSLTIIKFEDNLIETVGINLLSGLPKLRKANFSRNRCIKFSAESFGPKHPKESKSWKIFWFLHVYHPNHYGTFQVQVSRQLLVDFTTEREKQIFLKKLSWQCWTFYCFDVDKKHK